MSSVSGKAFDFKLFRRLLGHSKPYNGTLIGALILTISGSGLMLWRFNLIYSMVLVHVKNQDFQGLGETALIIVASLVVEALIQFLVTNMTNLVGQNVIRDLRIKLFGKISRFRLKYYDNNPIGRLVTRAISDIETIAEVFSQGIITISSDLLKLFGVIGMMFFYDWQLALAALAPIPILLWATVIFKKSIKVAFNDVRNEVANLNTFTQEHITGMKIVQIFNREEQESKTFRQINRRHMKAHIKTVWAFSLFFPVVEILSATSMALILLVSAMSLKNGSVDAFQVASNVLVFYLLVQSLYRPIRMIADRFNTLQQGMIGSERVFKVLDTEEYVKNNDKIMKAEFHGDISFKNVEFAYNEPEWVLKDVSFDVKAGETVAFVGATGAGKTSIISLLNRFYEYQNGLITIAGKTAYGSIERVNGEHRCRYHFR